MASIKKLKQSVKMITGSLFADCVAIGMCQQGDPETLEALMKEVVDLHTDALSHINHKRDKEQKDNKKYYHQYFQKFKADFTAKVNDLSERIVHA